MKRHQGDPQVSCAGKEALSQQVANDLVRRARGWKANAYRCQHCGFWHVGAGNRKKGKVRR